MAGDVEVYPDDIDDDIIGEVGVENGGVVAVVEDFFDLGACWVGGHIGDGWMDGWMDGISAGESINEVREVWMVKFDILQMRGEGGCKGSIYIPL